MPLESIHKFAFKAAEATHCAEEQGKFWEMSHRLFEQQSALEPWKAHAEALGLDVPKFEACLASGKHAAAIRKDVAEAQKAGVTGTPAFLIAVTDPSDATKVKGLTTLRGAMPYDRFKTELDQALAAAAR
jgi:predicted DsbA family dithiol-disulfide isomerase